MSKKLNTFSLAGLIIGPIFGSGLILLPSIIYNKIGNHSLFVWISIIILGFLFAIVFGKLSALYRGDGGVSLATKEALGKKYQLLTSFYLICAVLFGPVAVLLIAAQFIMEYFPNYDISYIAFFIYAFAYILLLIRINILSRIMLIVSTTISIIFFLGSIYTLYNVSDFTFNLPTISINEIGYSFLIIFWSIVGWEVIGNYSNEVKDSKTLIKAVIISATVISIVYFLLALAICFGGYTKGEFKLVFLIQPLFGTYSNIILSSISLILCIGTLILFVGSVSRLISSMNFTSYSSKRSKNGVPIGALNILSVIYLLILVLVYFKYLTLDMLVASADGFFIANAIIGLITAIKIFDSKFLKISASILSILFFIILLFSNIFILLSIFLIFLFVYFKK